MPKPGHRSGGGVGLNTQCRASRRRLLVWACGALLGLGTVPASQAAPPYSRRSSTSLQGPTLARRAFSEEEIAGLWENKIPVSAEHRRYVFIDEADIVEGSELPLYRVEASRYGARHQLERMARGDPGLSDRIADLAPQLAAETEFRRRSSEAFFASRPGVARDVPETPDLLGPLLNILRSRD